MQITQRVGTVYQRHLPAEGGWYGLRHGVQVLLEYLVDKSVDDAGAYAFGGRIHRSQFRPGGVLGGIGTDSVFRVYQFQATRTLAGLSVTANPVTTNECAFLLIAEMKKPQGQHAGLIGNLHQQAAASPEPDVRQLDATHHHRFDTDTKAANRGDLGAVLVSNGQMKKQVPGLPDTKALKPGREAWAYAMQAGKRMCCQ